MQISDTFLRPDSSGLIFVLKSILVQRFYRDKFIDVCAFRVFLHLNKQK